MRLLSTKRLLLCLITCICLQTSAQQLAFPGAEGFGRYATGGRGGTVYHVTNLNDTGSGSFRDAVSQPNRIVVFDVAGIIKISSRIVVAKNITIAGQTAPANGITIYGDGLSFSGADNTICRYIRVRMGKNGTSGKDAIGIANGTNMIFDHVSVSWGLDETFSISWDGKGSEPGNITIQNCIIGQGLQTHSCGGLIQTSGGVSILRCLYIDNKTRNPKVKGVNQFVNNIIYNWGGGGAYIEGDSEADSYVNVENNYFIDGPSRGTAPFTRGNSYFHIYANENYYDNTLDGVLNGSLIPLETTSYAGADLQSIPYNYPQVNKIAIPDLYNHIIQNVGAVLPSRDQVDTMLIGQLQSLGLKGALIANESTDNSVAGPGIVFGGYPKSDTDQDGIPDSWEDANGLNKNDASDTKVARTDGWTNIEHYINSITAPEPFIKNPVAVTATAVSESQINLTWLEYSSDESGFIIQRSVNNVDFTSIDTVSANITTYNDNSRGVGLTKNTTYYYRIKAYNANLHSIFSPAVSAKTLSNIAINPVPANDSRYVNPDKIIFSWTASANSYRFYLGTDPSSMILQADNLTSTTYTLTNIADGQVYYWRVDAVTNTETLTGDTWTFYTKKKFPLGMVAHWKLDETSGETSVDDTDYDNDGTLVNLDNAKWEPGLNGNSLNFTGTDASSHIKVPHSESLYFDNNPFSIALWMKAPTTQGECYLIHKGSFVRNTTLGTTGKWFGIQIKDKFTFAVDDDVTKTNYDVTKTDFTTGQWVHVVAVRDTLNKKLVLYKNGVKYGEKSDATKNSIGQTEALILGNSTDNNVPFRGSLDDVRLYNYALTATEITDLYNSSIPVPGTSVYPVPSDGYNYTDVNMPILSWSAGSAANMFDVYWGTSPTSLVKVSSDQVVTSYKVPQILACNTQYYWRVDSKNSKGITTGTVWTLKTQKSIPNSIIGHWKFEEASGVNVADSSAYHNDGIITKVADPVREPGRLGKALNLNIHKDSSHLEVPFADHLFFNKNPFSISLWMKISSAPLNSSYLIFKGSFVKDSQKGTNGKWYGIEIKGANIYFSVDDDVTKTALSATSAEFCTGQWVHLVAIRDTVNKLLKLYRNGTKVAELADKTGTVENFENLFLANNRDQNAPFPGALDEVRLYNYALSETEITALFNEDSRITKPYDLLPADQTKVVSKEPLTLIWKGDINVRTYNIYVGNGVNNLEQKATGLTTLSYVLTGLNTNSNYYWKVEAVNNTYTISSDIISFTTLPELPGKPTELLPSDLSGNVDTVNVILSWKGDANTAWYNVYLGSSESNLEIKAFNTTANNVNLTSLAANTKYYWRVDAGNSVGITQGSVVSFTTGSKTVTGIHDTEDKLSIMYPNPFSDKLTIGFVLNSAEKVKLQISDMTGCIVKTLADNYLHAGRHTFEWDGRSQKNEFVKEGVYFYILQAGTSRKIGKIIFVKK